MRETLTDRDVLTQSNRPTTDGKGGAAAASLDGGAVKDAASKVGDQLVQSAEQQKIEGANFVGGIAGAVRRAAREFEGDVPQAAQYIRLAADQLDGVADAVRKRDFNRILADVQDFARQRPVAFFGAAVFAGFAAVRFLKTSAPGPGVQSTRAASQVDSPGTHWSPPTAMQMTE